jgi:Predicted phosphohydrolases
MIKGFYNLSDVHDGGLVFISMPDGYKPKDVFWQRVQQGSTTVNFILIKTPAVTSFRFMHASDTHISEKSVNRMDKLRAIIETEKPNFVMITGDLVKDALRVSEAEASGYYELFSREVKKISPPVWLVPGNHEIFGIERHLSLVSPKHPLYGKQMFKHYLGPNYYSFNYGGIHFVGLDDVDYEDLWYYGHVDSVQFEWLKKDLASIPSSMPVVTFNHIPFFSGGLSMTTFTETGLGRTLELENGIKQFRHVVSNARELLDEIGKHPYPLALSGHYHSRQVFWYESTGQKIRFEQTAAVVDDTHDENITLPSGVTVYSVTNGKIDEGKFILLDKK